MLITSVEKNKNNDRFSVYIDNSFAFTISEEDYLRLGFYEKREITKDEIEKVKYDINLRDAKSAAIKYLAFKLRTEKEIRDKLYNKGFEEEIVSSAIDELKSSGYIDDRLYASKYISDRLKLKPRSGKLLQYELECRGVARDDIFYVLNGTDLDELSIAESLVNKKFGKFDCSDEKIVKRIYSFLSNRGFDYGIINEVIGRITKY